MPQLALESFRSIGDGANVDELARTTSIERVLLGAPDKVVGRLGRANPRLAISNGEACFIGGQAARHFGDFYPARPSL